MSIAATMAAAIAAIALAAVTVLLWRTRRLPEVLDMYTKRVQRLDGAVVAIHFIEAFDRLIKDGRKFGDRDWEVEYWRIHSTEYQFFAHSALPVYIFELWMIELVLEYAESPDVVASHREYLDIFEVHNSDMTAFFATLANIAVENQTRKDQVFETANYVRSCNERMQ